MSNTEKLAREFARLLKIEVGEDDFNTIAKQTEKYKTAGVDTCVSHDFCDSNMLMNDAFNNLYGEDINPINALDLQLVNEAWELAKEQNFWAFWKETY